MEITEEYVEEVHQTCRSRIKSFQREAKKNLTFFQLVEYQTLERDYGIVMLNCESTVRNRQKLCELIGWLTLEQNELPPNKRKMYRIEFTSFIEPK